VAAKEKAYDVNLILATNSAKKSMPEAAAADGYESGDQGLHQPLLQAAFRGTAAAGRAAGEGADRLATPFGEPSAPSNSSAGQPSRGNVWDEVPAVARGVSEKEHEERRQSLDTLIQDNSCRRVLASLRVCDSCLSSLLAHLLRQEATCCAGVGALQWRPAMSPAYIAGSSMPSLLLSHTSVCMLPRSREPQDSQGPQGAVAHRWSPVCLSAGAEPDCCCQRAAASTCELQCDITHVLTQPGAPAVGIPRRWTRSRRRRQPRALGRAAALESRKARHQEPGQVPVLRQPQSSSQGVLRASGFAASCYGY
jgi:hypothetical protein